MTENKTRIKESIQKLEDHLLKSGFKVEKLSSRKWNVTIDGQTLLVKVKAFQNGDQAIYEQVEKEFKAPESDTLQDKAKQAAKRFVERRGYKILDTDYTCKHGSVDIVAKDDDCIVFISTSARLYEMPEGRLSKEDRKRAEIVSASWLAKKAPEGDLQVRFDEINMLVCSPDRALVQHHINCFGTK